MKLVKKEPEQETKMNMTPMIDVVFQLLIFFMLVTEMQQRDKVELRLPRADQATTDQGEPGRHTINIDKDGNIRVGSTRVTLDRLDEILYVEAQERMREGSTVSEKPILIRADKEAEFLTVQKIMGKCVKHKIWKLSFGAMGQGSETDAKLEGNL